jgi:hypothetical protein
MLFSLALCAVVVKLKIRRGGRAVEGARLELVYTATPYRGFESLPLRHPPSRGTRYGVMPRRSETKTGCLCIVYILFKVKLIQTNIMLV